MSETMGITARAIREAAKKQWAFTRPVQLTPIAEWTLEAFAQEWGARTLTLAANASHAKSGSGSIGALQVGAWSIVDAAAERGVKDERVVSMLKTLSQL